MMMGRLKRVFESALSCLCLNSERDFEISDVEDYFPDSAWTGLLSEDVSNDDFPMEDPSGQPRNSIDDFSMGSDEDCQGLEFRLSRWDLFLTFISIIWRRRMNVGSSREGYFRSPQDDEDCSSTALNLLENVEPDASVLADLNAISNSHGRGRSRRKSITSKDQSSPERTRLLIDLSDEQSNHQQSIILGLSDSRKSKESNRLITDSIGSDQLIRSPEIKDQRILQKKKNTSREPQEGGGENFDELKRTRSSRSGRLIVPKTSTSSSSSSSSNHSYHSSSSASKQTVQSDLFSIPATSSSVTTTTNVTDRNDRRRSRRVMDSETIKMIHQQYNGDCRRMFGCDLSRTQIRQIFEYLESKKDERECNGDGSMESKGL